MTVRYVAIALSVAVAMAGAVVTSASAAGLDGSYTSNVGNRLTIKGSSYTYRHRSNPNSFGSGTIRKMGGSSYQFRGILGYVCHERGNTLSCGGGRRVWTRN